MKKNLLTLLTFLLSIFTLQLSAQNLSDYTFSTGVDASKWITLSTTTSIATTGDGGKSDVTNIGFPFIFGEETYTQFSVNADGNLRFGPIQTGTANYSTPFSSSNANANNPKINFLGCDGFLTDSGYIYHEVVGTAPDRICVIEFATSTYSSTSRPSLLRWQIQLFEGSDNIQIVYASTNPPILPNVARQPGMCIDNTDIILLDTNHQMTHYTEGQSTANIAIGNWPDVNRYYLFNYPLVSCRKVFNLAPTVQTVNSISLEYEPFGDETSWQITYYPVNDTNDVSTITVSTTTPTLTGLTSNTEYVISVYSVCSNGSGLSMPRTIHALTLPVNPATLPYECNFEDPDENDNWTFLNGDAVNRWIIGGNTSFNDDQSLYISNDGSHNAYYTDSASVVFAIRDIYFDPTYDSYSIQFDYKGEGQMNTDYFRLYFSKQPTIVTPNNTGVLTAPAGSSYLTVGGSGSLGLTPDWRHFNMELDNTYSGRTVRFYFTWVNNNNTGTNPPIAIDNFSVTGNSCSKPYGVHIYDSIPNTLTVTWQDSSYATAFDVALVPYYGESPEITAVTVTESTYTFTDVPVNQYHTLYLRSICQDGKSAWAAYVGGPQCAPISTLPYIENFDAYGTGTGSGTGTSAYPTCWSRQTNNTSTTTYPYINTTQKASGTGALYFYGTTSYYAYAVLPEIDTTTLSFENLMLSFKGLITSTTTTYGRFDVGVMTDPNDVNTFITVKNFDHSDFPATTTWYNFEVPLSSYTGSGSYIAIRVPATGSNYLYIDDVVLDEIPTCAHPENLTITNRGPHGFRANWTTSTPVYAFEIALLSPLGAAMETATITTVSTTYADFTELNSSSSYQVYVRAICDNDDNSEWFGPVNVYTLCESIDEIPFTENFDTYGGSGSAYFPGCWVRHTDYSTNYPYISTTQHASGTSALYFYSSTSNHSMAASQALDLSQFEANTLALRFKLRKTSASYGRLDVGIMTDPDNMNSMTILKSIYPPDIENTTDWEEFLIPLTEQYEDVIYIGFIAPERTTNYVYLDDVSVDYMPTCSAPSGLTVSSIAGTSALVSWDSAPFGIEDYTLEYAEVGQDNWNTVTTEENSYLLSDLTQGTAYEVMLYSNCTEGTTDTLTGSFSTLTYMGCAQEDTVGVSITGNSSVTTYYVPVNNYYKYSYNQIIYTANEINPAHTPTVITGIAFQYNYGTPMTVKNDVKLYMAHRTDSIFNSTTDWTPIDNATLVYEGPLNCSQGWNKFDFTNFFSYNGTDNLVLIVDDDSYALNGTAYNFNAHSKTNSVLYKGNDSENIDPSNPPAGTRSANRTNTKIYTCEQTFALTCVAPNVYDYAVESDNITFSWTAGLDEISWEMRYKASTDNDWTTESVTASPYTIENLTAATDYTVEMRSSCGNNEYSDWLSLNISTPCDDITIPFFENFENTMGSSYACFVPCWSRKTNYTTSYPYVTTNTTAPSGSNVLSLNASSTYYSYAVTPRFAEDVVMDSLHISFQARKSSASYFVEIGIMTDPANPTTFQNIGNFTPTEINEWQQGEIKTSSYTGDGRYVAFRVPQWISNIMLVDDIMIDYIPNCLHVEDIQLTDVTATTATIRWTPGGDETTWMYVYGPAGTVNINTIGDEAWQTIFEDSVMLEELTGNTAYEIFVKAACDNGETSTIMSYSFRTSCVPISTLPYIENFDDWGTATTSSVTAPGPIPACWTRNYNYSSPMPYCNSTYKWNGVAGLYFYASGAVGYTELIATPQLDDNIEVSELELSFMCRAMSAVSYLYIGVMDNPNNLASFVLVDSVSANSSTWRQERVLFTNYEGTGKYIALKFAPSASGYFMVDNFVLDIAPSCTDPTNLTLNTISTNSASISWEDNDEEGMWQVLVSPASVVSPDFNNAETVENNSLDIQDLYNNTDYNFYVRTVCANGEGYSHWMSTNFTTLLSEPAEIPYENYFENGEENASWYILNGTQANKWYIGQPTGETDSVLFVSQNGNSTDYNISSTSNVWAYRDFSFGDGVEFVISFSWKGVGEGANDYMKVYLGTPAVVNAGTTTAPDNAVQLGDILNGHDTWQHFEAALNSSYANTTQRLYFLWHNNASLGTSPAAVVDSISIHTVDCGRPYNLAVSAIDEESATITFTPASESDNTWEYIFANGVFPNDSNVTPQTVQNNTISLTGLDENTIYSLYVRTVCGGGSYSGWSEIVTFHTLCVAISTLPYTENFNSYTSGSTSTTAPSGYPDVILPDCWTIFNMSESTSTYPQVFLTSSTTYAVSGNCLFFKSSSTTPAYAALPSFTTAIQDLQITFTYRNEGISASNGTLHVGYMTSPADPASFVSVYTCPQINTLTDVELAFNNIAYTGNEAVIAFKYEGGSSNNFYVSIDNVVVDNIPTCPKPTELNASNITANSLTLSWTAGGNESEWIVEYGTPDFFHGTGTTVQAQDTFISISGLSGSMNYDFYVKAVCGAGDTSLWSRVYRVSTDCGIVTELPFAENFDSYGTGESAYPNCWTKLNTYSYDRPYIHTTHYEGVGSLYFYTATQGTYNIAITPEFDGSIAINSLKANFMYRAINTSDRLVVGVMTDNTDASTFVPVDTIAPSSPASTWVAKEVSFGSYTGNGHYIAFRNSYTTTNTYTYIDNLVISLDSTYVPECDTPTGLAISTITQTSATATWTAGGTETTWNLQYKTASATNWSSSIAVSATNYQLTNLTAETTYQVRVQANCGNGSTSGWTVPVSFTTPAAPAEPCDAPTNLQVTNITQNSATVSWTAGGSETSWKVQYKLTDESQWQEITVQQPSCELEGLTANSTYELRVKAVCSDDNESDFISTTFTTQGVGIDNITLANSIILMPNPADNYIELRVKSNVEVKEAVVFNAFGQTIQTVELIDNHARIDLSNMAAGMYFVRVNGEGVTATKKFVRKQ